MNIVVSVTLKLFNATRVVLVINDNYIVLYHVLALYVMTLISYVNDNKWVNEIRARTSS